MDHPWLLKKKIIRSKYSIFLADRKEEIRDEEVRDEEVHTDEEEELAYMQLQEQEHCHDNQAEIPPRMPGSIVPPQDEASACAVMVKKPAVASKYLTPPTFGRLFSISGKNGTSMYVHIWTFLLSTVCYTLTYFYKSLLNIVLL